MQGKKKDKELKNTNRKHLTEYDKKLKKDLTKKRKRPAWANFDELVKTQEKELDLKRRQNYRANCDESMKTQQKEINSKCL